MCDLPVGRKTLTLKWKFERKTKADGSIERYTIGHEVDYGETYSPLVRYPTDRLMVVSARLRLKVKIHQLNPVTVSRQIVEQCSADVASKYRVEQEAQKGTY